MSLGPANPDYVLVVDDDADIREVLGMLLESAGHGALCATDGADALRKLQARQRLPRIILLDIMMPGMNGWEFRAAQTQDPRLAAIPVVILSGDGNVEDKAKSMGAAGWLQKPVELHTLLATIGRYCTPSTGIRPE